MAMINPELKTFQVSARTGQGFDRWMEWLAEQTKNKKLRAS
jgi:Ni2+-binding GTPase involved in maturation of urease and hydrogenase